MFCLILNRKFQTFFDVEYVSSSVFGDLLCVLFGDDKMGGGESEKLFTLENHDPKTM